MSQEEPYVISDAPIEVGGFIDHSLALSKEDAMTRLARMAKIIPKESFFLYRLVPVARVRTETVVESIEE